MLKQIIITIVLIYNIAIIIQNGITRDLDIPLDQDEANAEAEMIAEVDPKLTSNEAKDLVGKAYASVYSESSESVRNRKKEDGKNPYRAGLKWLECLDSDGGKDFEKKGIVNMKYSYKGKESIKTFEDKCDDNKQLIEYHCRDKRHYRIVTKCDYWCYEGTCKTQPKPIDTSSYLDEEKRFFKSDNKFQNLLFADSLTRMRGYLIEFKEEPLIKLKTRLEGGIPIIPTMDAGSIKAKELEENEIKSKLVNQEAKIMGLHAKARKDIFGVATSSNSGIVTASSVDNKVLGEYSKVFSGIAVDIPEKDVNRVKSLDYVKDVYPNLEVKALLMDSVTLINADKVWELDSEGNDCIQTGKECLTGKGVTIAIIDTGVDYTHPDLGGCSREQFLDKQCSKVVGGYDFVDNDDDPMDDSGHGTHVASTAAGNGILKGVAPDASLYAYKVLDKYGQGYESDIIKAIERAVDLNQDTDFSDHLDIISMSLGSNCYIMGGYNNLCGPDDPISKAVDNAVEAGIVVTVAAGNSGPYKNTIGSPAAARNSISVGANYNYNSISKVSRLKIIKPNEKEIHSQFIFYSDYSSNEAKEITTELVNVKSFNEDVNGKIALVKAVDLDNNWEFVKKGPEAIILYDYGKVGDFSSLTIPENVPLVAIFSTDAKDIIKEMESNSVVVNLKFDKMSSEIAAFSSRGPVIFENEEAKIISQIKPDIVAPGLGICAAKYNIFAEHRKCYDNKHTQIEGTSMATPHVAGALALLKQSKPTWNPYQLKYAIRETAQDLGKDLHSQGYGMIDTESVIRLDNPPLVLYIKSEYYNRNKLHFDISADSKLQEYSISIASDKFPYKWSKIKSVSLENPAYKISMELSTEVLEQGIYLVKIEAVDVEGRSGKDITLVSIDKDMLENFPLRVDGMVFSLKNSDLDNDGLEELIVHSAKRVGYSYTYGMEIWETYILVFNSDFSPKWKKTLSGLIEVHPAIADINGDEYKEIIMVGRNEERKMFLYTFDKEGNVIWQVPLNSEPISINVGNVDDDAEEDIIVSGFNVISLSPNGLIEKEIVLKDKFYDEKFPAPVEIIGPLRALGIAIGDVTGDSKKEIVLYLIEPGDPFNIYKPAYFIAVLDNKLEMVKELKIKVIREEFTKVHYFYTSYDKLVLGDLTGDGIDEIILSTDDKIYAYSGSNLLEGFPFEYLTGRLLDSDFPFADKEIVSSLVSLSLADTNQDGSLEILASAADYYFDGKFGNTFGFLYAPTETIFVIDKNGKLLDGWPKRTEGKPCYSQPIIGDVMGDLKNEILHAVGWCNTVENGEIHIYDDKGFEKTRKDIHSWILASPLIANLNNDNKIEVVIGTADGKMSNNYLFVWSFDKESNKGSYEWPMHHHDAANSNNYPSSALPKRVIIKLKAGQNLVSFPIDGIKDKPIEEVMSRLEGSLKTVYGYDASTPDNPWRIYDPNIPKYANTLNRLDPEQGYWVLMKEDDSLILGGDLLPVDDTWWKILNGWQMVGWGNKEIGDTSKIAEKLGGFVRILEWDSNSQSWKGSFSSARAFNTLNNLTKGNGYWLMFDKQERTTIASAPPIIS